jgi:hypothetical protein
LSKFIIVACVLAAFASAEAIAGSASIYMREVDLMDAHTLVQIRQNCALNQMPGILAKVQRDNPGEKLPAADAYCLRAIAVSATHNELLDLYIDLALQEQGYDGLHFAEDEKLLQHDETGQTAGSIFRAAGGGATSYVSITGKTRGLTCPLALDAGYTWGYRNPDKPQPVALTAPGAAAIARACYDPSVTQIAVGADTLPAAKAGVYAGA